MSDEPGILCGLLYSLTLVTVGFLIGYAGVDNLRRNSAILPRGTSTVIYGFFDEDDLPDAGVFSGSTDLSNLEVIILSNGGKPKLVFKGKDFEYKTKEGTVKVPIFYDREGNLYAFEGNDKIGYTQLVNIGSYK